MDFKVGDMISVRHYSGSDLSKAIVIEKNFDIISIKLSKRATALRIQKGEPIVIGFESKNMVYISSCTVMSVEEDEKMLSLRADSIETLANKRLFERFPVSFESKIKIGSSKTEYFSLIKNISFSGMLVVSREDFPLYQELKFDLDIGEVLELKAVIIRKDKESENYEYGLKIVYTDPTTPTKIKKHLHKLKSEQEQYVNNFPKNKSKT